MSQSTATGVATIANGQVTEVTVTNPGSGYTATPTVVISGGGGAGALVLANVANQSVSGFKVTNGGRGFNSTPDVNITLDGGSALLTYGILTNPQPLQVPQSSTDTAALTLVVSNSGSQLVQCASFTVTLPGPGQLAQDLTNSFTGIGVVVPVDGNGNALFTSSQSGGAFTFTPVTQAAGQIGANGVTFGFNNILVNNTVGSCDVKITEIASSPINPNGSRQAPDIELQKWPTQFSMAQPTATPPGVVYGGSSDIAWSVKGNGVTTSISYDPDGKGLQTYPEANVDSKSFGPLTNSAGVIFTVIATVPDPGHSQPMVFQRQTTVSVTANPTVNFTIQANPITPGQPLTFTLGWTVVDVSSFQITANDGPNGNTYVLPVPFATQGTYVVTPHLLNVTYTFQVLSSTLVTDPPGHHHEEEHHHKHEPHQKEIR